MACRVRGRPGFSPLKRAGNAAKVDLALDCVRSFGIVFWKHPSNDDNYTEYQALQMHCSKISCVVSFVLFRKFSLYDVISFLPTCMRRLHTVHTCHLPRHRCVRRIGPSVATQPVVGADELRPT